MPNRPGWAADEVRPGDLIVAGTNFGCGSSRSAPRVRRDELNLSCVVAESFSRLFQRNAVNIGFPVLICPGITAFALEGDELEVDFDSGLVRNHLALCTRLASKISVYRLRLSRSLPIEKKELRSLICGHLNDAT